MNVMLEGESQRFIEEELKAGRYPSAEEVVQAALKLLRERRAKHAQIRAKIAIGLEQAKRGELLDGEEVFDEIFGPIQGADDRR